MKIKELFQKFFYKKEDQYLPEVKKITDYSAINIPKAQVNENIFTCHYCGNRFEFQSKDIFPTSVRLLYKDQFVTGKGIKCPKCLKDSIFG